MLYRALTDSVGLRDLACWALGFGVYGFMDLGSRLRMLKGLGCRIKGSLTTYRVRV